MPPTIPAISPENQGAPEPNAIPKQSGSATRNTTNAAGISDKKFLEIFFILIHFG